MKNIIFALLFICAGGMSLQVRAQACTTITDPDFTICANVDASISYDLGGNYGSWSQVGSGEYLGYVYGSGSFTYIANDYARAKGKDTIVLHNDGMYNYCYSNYTDTIIITLTPAPKITVPADLNLCSTASSFSLSAAVQNATGMIWTTDGSGTISPDFITPAATYTLSPADKAAGSVYVVGTTTGNGTCYAEDDTIFVTITDIAGLGITTSSPADVCGSDKIAVNSTQSGGPVVTTQWTSSGSGTFLKPNDLNTEYLPSTTDITTGTVTLTMSLIGPCPTISSSTTTTIHNSESITISAGTDFAGCFDGDYYTPATAIPMSGSITSGYTGTWSVITYDGGSFDNGNNTVNAEYTPSIYAGGDDITLRFTADATGYCINTYDEVVAHINWNPYISGNFDDDDICSNEKYNVYDEGPIIGDAVSAAWTSSGTGTFYPGNTSMDYIEYTPSAADVTAGNFNITVVVRALPGCPDLTETHNVVVYAAPPTPNAGPDQLICDPDDNNSSTLMTATPNPISSQYTGYWSYYGLNNPFRTQSPANQRPGQAQPMVQGSVYIYDNYDPATQITMNYDGTVNFTWQLYEENTGCYSDADTVAITHLTEIYGADDVFSIKAGDSIVYNLSTNDTLYGLPFIATLSNPTDFTNTNTAALTTVGDSIYLKYVNRSPYTAGSDQMAYTIATTGAGNTGATGNCIMSSNYNITVNLLNGHPVLPDTSTATTTIVKKPNQVTTFTVDLRRVFTDYDLNIDWSTLKIVSMEGEPGELPDTLFGTGSNRYMMTVTYSSTRAAAFRGTQTINFRLCDNLNACNTTLRYNIEVLPDYENPSIKGEDFEVINAVSPNGDNVNDYLRINGIEDYHTTVVIFNRWSQKVWEGENYNNKTVRFEGVSNVNGSTEQLPEGTYFYVIKNEGKEENGQKMGLHSGYLELRR